MFNVYAFLTYVLVNTYTPGPNNIMSMNNASRMGFKKSLPFDLGVFCGFLLIMVICSFAGAALFSLFPSVRQYMQIIGAGYILWLAYKTWKTKPGDETGKASTAGFTTGIVMQFINPKFLLYALTALSTYILPYFSKPSTLLIFSLALSVIGLTSTLCWGAFGAVFHKLLKEHARLINGIMALLLAYCAAALFM